MSSAGFVPNSTLSGRAHGEHKWISDGWINRPRDAAESIHTTVTCAAFSVVAGRVVAFVRLRRTRVLVHV
ncbi:hypothetical protein FRAAL6576 [Frankia alni ACN14a]|uniref:Uncharacterized protein n=1 Tax=Frankia alni (strain DSM 45986 / CECT 9034 / ACN14a) TaxID=326424 RepID=Q0RBI6_FRAAA|nr:hypothetical protein FRAAL6576 [Frankia alni ACN14a]